ncbi:hypothetical protein G4B88_000178 [Cannabis sativa]|uniref:DUF4283 domain-containing protein n=1 Tax=Cannabis sativa TaxID=3483 RepID=A0A7J6GKZ5_CANSA|nr:hypothetical protein G4B88_000178 [Cannabis sativa]
MAESTVDEIVQLTDQLGMNQEEEWEVNEEQVAEFGEKSLVGRIVSKQSVSVGLFKTMFSRMWKSIGEWKVKSLNDDKEYQYFGLSFNSRAEAKRTLEKQPWLFNGGMLMLEEWPTSGQWRDARLDSVSCWVRMRGLPLKALTLNNIKQLGNMAGKVEDIVWNNPQQIFLNGYVRVKIGFSIQREVFVGRYIPVDGGKRWVQFKFDKLPLLCFKCGFWGHDQSVCTKALVMEMNSQGTPVPKYGQWLKEEDPTPNCFMAYDQLMARQGGGKVNSNGGHGIDGETSRPEIGQSEHRGSHQAVSSGKEQFSRLMQVEQRVGDGVDRGSEVNGATESDKLKGKIDTFSEIDQNGIFKNNAQSPPVGKTNLGPVDNGPLFSTSQLKEGSSLHMEVVMEAKERGHEAGRGNRLDSKLRRRMEGKEGRESVGVVVRVQAELMATMWGGGGGLCEHGEDVAVDLGDTERFEVGKSMGGKGLGKKGGESRKRISIKNKARAKARVGGAQSEGNFSGSGVRGTGEVVIFTAGDDGASGKDGDFSRAYSCYGGGEWVFAMGADVKLLDWWESDHRALVIDIPVRLDGDKCGKSKRKNRFHFEEAWCHEEECTEIVDKMWQEWQGRGRPVSFRCKVNKCGKALQDWNKKKKARVVFNPTDAELIMGMDTTEWDIEDKILWHYSKDGEYSAKSGNHASFVWRSLVWGKKVIQKGYRWRIGNGNSVRVLEDPWLPRPVTFKIYDKPSLPDQLYVIDLKKGNGEWDEEFIRVVFNPTDAELIMGMDTTEWDIEDKILWHYSKDGDCLV